MQWRDIAGPVAEPTARTPEQPSLMAPSPSSLFTFEIDASTPPPVDAAVIMQRADEVNTIQRMLTEAQTSAVILIGLAGAGKSTLAALLFHRLLLAQQTGLAVPRYLIWLTIGKHTTIPDLLSAILDRMQMNDPSFFLMSPGQQISTLLQALRRPQENALIVLDQFESFLHPETQQDAVGRGSLMLFLELLQTELGTSRILLTSYESPYDQNMEETRVRTYLVSRMNLPEGGTLMQQYGIQASPEDLSVAWQRCAGHVFALILLCALVHLSGISLNTFLNAPQYQWLWNGDVTSLLVASVFRHLNPLQYVIMRALSLFEEPVSLPAITQTIMSTNTRSNGNDANTPYSAFENALATLLQYSLLHTQTNAQGEQCYTLHTLLRSYIIDHYLEGSDRSPGNPFALSLGAAPQQQGVNDREAQQLAIAAGHMWVATYYYNQSSKLCPPRDNRTGLQDIVPFLAIIRHLILGWHWQDACDLLFHEGLHEALVQWGAWNTLVGLYTTLLPPFGSLQRKDEALVSQHLATIYGRLGDMEKSQHYFEQALTAYHELDNRHGEATTLANQGELLRLNEQWEAARTTFEQVLLLNRQEQDPLLQCSTLHNLGLLYDRAKEFQSAQSYYLAALKLVYRLSQSATQGTMKTTTSQYMGTIMTNIGILCYQQKLTVESIALLLAAQQLRLALRDPGVVILERFLTAIEQQMGHDTYQKLCEEAYRVQKQVLAHYMNG